MKVNFFLTEPTYKIVGGYKMVYIYSNYMIEHGCDVTIYYFCKLNCFKDIIKAPVRYLLTKLPIQWFSIHPKIKRKLIFSYKNISRSDINIITASTLACDIYYNCTNTNLFIHFIQDYEKWCMSDKEIQEVFMLPTRKIVVSKWLFDIVFAFDDKVTIISNGVDLDKFYITTPIQERDMTICMLYHTDKRKGVDRGIEIINKLKVDFPMLKCIMFGSPKRGKNIPQWVEYHRNVDANELRDIYNKCRVFLSTSYYEGFGLTGLESIICGCALVSTNTSGVKEYALNNINALISASSDDERLYHNAKKLLINTGLRVKFNKNFSQVKYNYSQDNKNAQFYRVLEKHCK